MSGAMKLKMALTGELVGAVVVFRPGTTEEEARSALINVPCIDVDEGVTVNSFDPRIGSPVWYIP